VAFIFLNFFFVFLFFFFNIFLYCLIVFCISVFGFFFFFFFVCFSTSKHFLFVSIKIFLAGFFFFFLCAFQQVNIGEFHSIITCFWSPFSDSTRTNITHSSKQLLIPNLETKKSSPLSLYKT